MLQTVYMKPLEWKNHFYIWGKGQLLQILGRNWPSRPFTRPKGQKSNFVRTTKQVYTWLFTCGSRSTRGFFVPVNCFHKTLQTVYMKSLEWRNHVYIGEKGQWIQILGQNWPSRPFSRPKGQKTNFVRTTKTRLFSRSSKIWLFSWSSNIAI